MPSVALATVLVPFAIALLLGQDPLSAARAGLLVSGLITVGIVSWKPRWFWDHPQVEGLRELLGDRATAGLYYFFAVIFAYLSLVAPGP